MGELRISVVIPAFNRAHLVGDAIQSALEQEHPAHEIIVIDDGSTDGTAAAAARYPVRVISQKNQGCGGARNRGIRESSGELLAFLDSDDLWMPNRLSVQMRRLSEPPSVDIIFAHYREVHQMDGVERVVPTPIAGWSASAMLARREVFDRVGPYETDLQFAPDVSWGIRAREKGVPMAMMPEVLVVRRVHGQNLSVQRDAAFREYAHAIKAHLDRKRRVKSEE